MHLLGYTAKTVLPYEAGSSHKMFMFQPWFDFPPAVLTVNHAVSTAKEVNGGCEESYKSSPLIPDRRKPYSVQVSSTHETAAKRSPIQASLDLS